MGGYDLYGNYYEKSSDAWNAETAQMNEIDNQRIVKEQQKLTERQMDLEMEIDRLQKLLIQAGIDPSNNPK